MRKDKHKFLNNIFRSVHSALRGILDQNLLPNRAESGNIELDEVSVECEGVGPVFVCQDSFETLGIAALVTHEKLIELGLVVLDSTIILKESRVRVGLCRVINVSKVVKILAALLFEELELLGRVHADIAGQVLHWLRLHLVDCGRVAALRAVVKDSLLADGALEARHFEHEAE